MGIQLIIYNTRYLFALFFLCQQISYAQTFQIIKASNIHLDDTTGTALLTGDKISEEDEINFTNTDLRFGYAALIDLESRKRYLLMPNNKETGIQIDTVKHCLILSRTNTGTRSGLYNILLDIQTCFKVQKGENFLILGGELNMDINTKDLPMDEDRGRNIDNGTSVTSLTFSEKGNLIILGGRDGSIRFRDLKTGKQKMMLLAKENEFVFLTGDQYYRSSIGGYELLNVRGGKDIYPFEIITRMERSG